MDTEEYNRKLKLLAAKLEEAQLAHRYSTPELFIETREAFQKVKVEINQLMEEHRKFN